MKVTNPQTRAFAEAGEQDASQPRKRPIAFLNITRTIVDHIELQSDSNGFSIGQQIDAHLLNAANEGIAIQTVELEFARESWFEYASAIRRAY